MDRATKAFRHVDGYVADTRYPSKFHQSFQTPWIDAALTINAIVPPRLADEPFTFVDLGCGDGLGLILAAASHPQGHFIGVDAIPEHIARGNEVVRGIGLTNIELHHADFTTAMRIADGTAHYVTAQGVLAWISRENRAALMTLVAKWLRPGGAFCVGYNAYPGWAQIAPLQSLLRATAMGLDGTSTERFSVALEIVRQSGAIEADALAWIDDDRGALSEEYFAHEYLNAHWEPCWSGDVVRAMAERGCAYAASASPQRVREDLCLTTEWRNRIDSFGDAPARETATDLLMQTWYRRDIYLKMPGNGYETDEALAARTARWWALAEISEAQRDMTGRSLAGELNFDNPAARAIFDGLAKRPNSIVAISQASGLATSDLIHTMDALFVTGKVIPLDQPMDAPMAETTNAWLSGNGYAINGMASKYGAIAR